MLSRLLVNRDFQESFLRCHRKPAWWEQNVADGRSFILKEKARKTKHRLRLDHEDDDPYLSVDQMECGQDETPALEDIDNESERRAEICKNHRPSLYPVSRSKCSFRPEDICH
jgi:hypothetical protein